MSKPPSISSILIFSERGNSAEPCLLASAFDLLHIPFWTRGRVRECIIFMGRTLSQRTARSQRQSVQHDDYMAHAYCNERGFSSIVFCSAQYPTRAALSVAAHVLHEYEPQASVNPGMVHLYAEDKAVWPYLADALTRFQNPLAADVFLKAQKDLDDTTHLLHKTVDGILARGEKLEFLVEKSTDLSQASQYFLKRAQSQNKCCSLA